MFDQHAGRQFAQGHGTGSAPGISIQEAITEESLVVRAMTRGLGCQIGNEIRRQLAPFRPGNHRGFAPAPLALRHVREALIPTKQGGIGLVSAGRHP